MKWYGTYPDFEYNTPLDFCGEWVSIFKTLCNKSERQAFKAKFKASSVNYTTMQIILGIIVSVFIGIFTFTFSLVAMVIYYITFPIRFLVDVICAIYANFIECFW